MATAQIDRHSDFEDEPDDDELTSNFNAAAKHLQQLLSNSNINDQILLSLYGLYKVATVGKCNVARPSWYEIKAKQKWEAWHQIDCLTSDEAKEKYIGIIKDLDKNWQPDGESMTSSKKSEGWVNVSSMLKTDTELQENEKTIFDYVKEDNIDRVKQLLEDNIIDINALDENGLGLIHWACDRGNTVMLKVILSYNAEVNLIASDGQTGLHYAASCGHMDCVRVLLTNGADSTVKDEDDMTAVDVASDSDIANFITNFTNL